MNQNQPLASRGVYLLPNLLTTAGLFSGFYAVVSSMNGHFMSAAVAIFIAMIFDGLDGRVARMTNTQSDFGAEYDSMADMLSFGIAPSIVVYNWALSSFGKFGWLAAFIYVACAALRLARFNTQLEVADKRFFQGLASPAAAGVIASLVWVGTEYNIDRQSYGFIMGLMTILSGLLMVSNFKYHSFKEIKWKEKVNFVVMIAILLVFVIVASSPENILLLIFIMYACSGPFTTLRTGKKLTLTDIVGDEDIELDNIIITESRDDRKKTQQPQKNSTTVDNSKAKSSDDKDVDNKKI